jgi:hypothetical protein
MVGSGPDDGDVLEMGSARRRRRWVPGGRRSRLVLVLAGVCALLAVGGTLTALRLDSRAPADPALARLIAEVTTVPVNAGEPGNLNAVWSGNSSSTTITSLAFDFTPTPVSGPPLTENGKPEVLYVATEFCPYCVAENWALIVALSRFGSFSGLSTSRSDPVLRFRRTGHHNRRRGRAQLPDRPVVDPDRHWPAASGDPCGRDDPHRGEHADIAAVQAHRRSPAAACPKWVR